jgi:RimJ/RimL family protein N-acetyltransferase
MTTTYLFQSQRLGFRIWNSDDLAPFSRMNQDEEVMRHFPKTLTETESQEFINRMDEMYSRLGFCYFAVDEIESGQFIGFMGLAEKKFTNQEGQFIDIGWRLAPEFWNKGFATEGAKRILAFAKDDLQLTEIISIAPASNNNSIKVMEKIGMHYSRNFKFDVLKEYPALENCVWYSINL